MNEVAGILLLLELELGEDLWVGGARDGDARGPLVGEEEVRFALERRRIGLDRSVLPKRVAERGGRGGKRERTFMTVLSLCATTMTVLPAIFVSRASLTAFSLSWSSALVASSSSSTAGSNSTARAIAILCLCPPLSCTPFSPTSVLYLSVETNTLKEAGTHNIGQRVTSFTSFPR